jgi:hypothetical protein
MTMHGNRIAFSLALATTIAAASCTELPETQLKNRAGAAGKSAGGGSAGALSNGGAGSGGKPSAGSGGTAGGDTGGSTATGGSGGSTGGGSGKGGSGGQGAGSGTGGTGMDDGGEAGAMPGGAPGSGGSSGSSPTGDFFGDSRCNDQFVLCEDFEADALDTGIWEKRTSTGSTIDIDDTQHARGAHSAHFHAEDNGISYISQTQAFPAPDNKYYARMFVRFDSMPDAPDWAHWTVAGAGDSTGANGGEIRVGGQFNPQQGKNLFGVGTDGGDTGDWTNLDGDDGAKEVPVQEWVCLEWMFDGSSNTTQFWWDDVEHPSLATSETNHGGSSDPFILPTFDGSWFGWWLYQADTNPPAFDLWIDEIAINYERIGCEN